MAWTSNFPERFGELVGEMTYREVGEKLNISKATVGANEAVWKEWVAQG